MDFTGSTTAVAAYRLWWFVEKAAQKIGVHVEHEIRGTPTLTYELTASARSASGSSFHIDITYEHETLVATRHHFGSGRIVKRGAVIMLELWREWHGFYRWYGVPVELTPKVQKVVPSFEPFPLTEEYVLDGLLALKEAPPV